MNLQKYYTQTFSSMREKSRKRGHQCLIEKADLIKWLLENGVEQIWEAYVDSGYDKNLRPSVDRLDDYGTYEFSNMQLITWRENMMKGAKGEKHRRSTTVKNRRNFGKKIYQYNASFELLNVFENGSEASEKTMIHRVDINRVCNGKRKQSHGFIFSFHPYNKDHYKHPVHKLSKKVVQKSLNGEIIKEWESITAACIALNLNPSSVTSACKKRLKQTGGYKWDYALTGTELTFDK